LAKQNHTTHGVSEKVGFPDVKWMILYCTERRCSSERAAKNRMVAKRSGIEIQPGPSEVEDLAV